MAGGKDRLADTQLGIGTSFGPLLIKENEKFSTISISVPAEVLHLEFFGWAAHSVALANREGSKEDHEG